MKIVDGSDRFNKDRQYVFKVCIHSIFVGSILKIGGQMSKDLRETSAQAYQDVVMQMEARKWANEFNKQGVPKPVL